MLTHRVCAKFKDLRSAGLDAKCPRCQDVGWVCEAHPDKLWSLDVPNGCTCNAGEPCPDCNSSTGEDDPPRTGEAIRNVDAVRGKGRLH